MNSVGALSIFEFDGDRLPTVSNDDGLWLEFAPFCEVFGKDVDGQVRTLKKEPWARVSKFEGLRISGQKALKWYIHQDSVAGWLFGMQTAGMPRGLVEKVNRYKAESARALRDYWLNGGAINPRVTDMQAARLVDLINMYAAERPEKYIVLWQQCAIASVASIYGYRHIQGDAPPIWFGNVSRKLLQNALSFAIVDEVHKRAVLAQDELDLDYVHRHRLFTPHARQIVTHEIGFIRTMADQSRTKSEFWMRVENRYQGKPFQHGFGF